MRMTSAAIAVLLAAGYCATAPAYAQDAAALENRRVETETEYGRLVEAMTLSDQRLAELSNEISAIRKDNTTITSALIQAAKTERKLSEDIAEIEGRLDGLLEQEDGIKASLRERRGLLAEVLGALQRMGLNPPPAILVKPEDALSSVRSAIVLGAVVPEVRAETEILLADLRELASVRSSIDGERERLLATVREQAAEQQRLTLLLAEKERLLADSETSAAEERRKVEELAAKAGSLKELIASLESEIQVVRDAAEAVRVEAEERARRDAEAAGRPIPEANRLVGGLPFDGLLKKVSLPVSGKILRRFGEADGLGGHAQGDTVQTQSTSIVTSLADGTVLYAGAFRSYGQLLILDAGGGYHIVLAGMEKISVSSGQRVLAGEPVGAMGEARVASILALGSAKTSPELYIEFRKDGKPVDPSPWWADRTSGRTGNGT